MSLGGGLGLFMGLFLGALDNPIMQDQMTGRQQFIYTAKQMGRRSWGSCKAFAVMGLVFSAAECVVEKVLPFIHVVEISLSKGKGRVKENNHMLVM